MLKQIRQLVFSLIVLVVTMLIVSQFLNDVSASSNTTRLLNEHPPSTERLSISAIPLHIGNGPFGPPENSDLLFWIDTGITMDQYLFRDEGPIQFDIEIDRVVGRTDGNGYLLDPQNLIDNGVVTEKVQLQLLVWDVDEDYSGTDVQPEADKVYLNGNYIGNLSGANDTWSLTRLEFDVRYLRFAIPTCNEFGDPGGQQYLSECSSSPTPAVNEVRIDIDTANTDLIWAVEVDWAAISFEAAPPILFVHGKGGSEDGSLPCTTTGGGFGCEYWDKFDGQYYFNFRGKFSSAGFLTAITENYLGGEVSLAENANRLQPVIQNIKTRYGVNRINIVGHSKGGLDSRAYISNPSLNDDNDVATLITLASPHHGSYLADIANNLPEFALGWIGYSNTPALENVSENYMQNTFNPTHPAKQDVQYYTIAADAGEDYWYGRDVPIWQILAVPEASQSASAPFVWLTLAHFGNQKGDNDFLVTVNSAQLNGIPSHDSNNSYHLGNYALNHHSIRAAMQQVGQEDNTITNLVRGTLDVGFGGNMSQLQIPFSSEQSRDEATSSGEPSDSAVGAISGSINQGQTVSQIIGVDSQSAISFMLLWENGDIDLNLIDSNGNVITPSTTDPDVTYMEDRSGNSLGELFVSSKIILYKVTVPESGQWQAQITADPNLPGGQTNWVLLTSQESDVITSLTSNSSWYRLNDMVTVFATVKEGESPYLNANVQATIIAPDNTTQALSLYDDGSHGDIVPNDGIYTNSFTGNEFGTYRLSVDASGTAGTGIPFQRIATEEVQVGSGTAVLGSVFSDFGLDTDGDGLYNILRVNVPAQINSAGEYMVSGVLQDSTGVEMGRANAVATYTTGSQIVALDFDASAIWANGGQGIFSLHDLRLLDRSNTTLPIQVDYSSEAYTTQSYSNGDFQHSPVALTDNSNDFGIDTNDNGKYDELVIEVEVFVEQAGNYTWNARLVDMNGYEFGWDSAIGYLSTGNNTIPLRYNGKAIYSNRVDGPYFLKDFVLWGDGGYLTMVNAANTLNYDYRQFEPVPERLFLPIVLNNYSSEFCSTVPSLLGPANGSNLSTISPLYQWDSGNASDATTFRLQLATDPNFTQPVSSLWSGGSSGVRDFRFPRNLDPATTYYWRAWLMCDDTEGAYSDVWSFTTGYGGVILPAPILIAPTNGSVPPSSPVTLQWSPVGSALEYIVRWRQPEYGGYTYSWVTETEQALSWLDPSVAYEWWTSARNDYAIGADSETWQFTSPSTTSIMRSQDIPNGFVKIEVYDNGEHYTFIEQE